MLVNTDGGLFKKTAATIVVREMRSFNKSIIHLHEKQFEPHPLEWRRDVDDPFPVCQRFFQCK